MCDLRSTFKTMLVDRMLIVVESSHDTPRLDRLCDVVMKDEWAKHFDQTLVATH